MTAPMDEAAEPVPTELDHDICATFLPWGYYPTMHHMLSRMLVSNTLSRANTSTEGLSVLRDLIKEVRTRTHTHTHAHARTRTHAHARTHAHNARTHAHAQADYIKNKDRDPDEVRALALAVCVRWCVCVNVRA